MNIFFLPRRIALSIAAQIARHSAQKMCQEGGGKIKDSPVLTSGSQMPTPVGQALTYKIESAEADDQIGFEMKDFPLEFLKASANHNRSCFISTNIGTNAFLIVFPPIFKFAMRIYRKAANSSPTTPNQLVFANQSAYV